jgi:RNA polymerase sigma-70 factor (ECF subfamily)
LPHLTYSIKAKIFRELLINSVEERFMGGDEVVKENNVPATAPQLKPVPQSGGLEELDTLFQQHYDQVYRTAYRITGSPADAEDVLQTIFMRLAGNTTKRDLAPSPASYLHRAAVNASLDLMRSRTRARSVPFEDVDSALLQSPILNPEAQHADSEMRALIRQAVARLGTRASEVFVLRYFEGYDNGEIAEMLGMSQMVVAVTLHRARVRLRGEIGEYLEKHHEA